MGNATDILKILLVEDNPADARFLKIALEEEMPGRFELVHETRLGEAVQTFDQGEFDLVLLDLSLPDETGFATFHRMSQAAADAPIVVMTGLDDEAMARKALQAGAQDYLVKGQVQRQALLKALRFALERHQSRRSSLEELEQWALKDSFTGLLNRRGLQKAFLEEIAAPDFTGSNLFALLVGLDNFKAVLDTFGRASGDTVLRETAKKIKACLPPKAQAAWLQGDEFLILLPGTRADEAAFTAEKIRSTIAESPVPWSSEAIHLSCGVGAVLVPQTVSTLNELLSHTHFVLAQSKAGSKNKISYSWDFGGSGAEIPETSLRGGTEEAVSSRFFVSSQPIYRLSDNRQTGLEFFIRTNFPGFEKPRDFFRLCLQTNIVSLMDYQSFRVCADFSRSTPAHLNCHFNLFPRTLADIPVSLLLECLSGTRPYPHFCVEVNEERIMGDPAYLVTPLQELKRAGVKIALDEVGFGHSSMESLLLLEPNIIKVAKTFVKDIEKSRPKARALKRFLKVAESLGAEVIVEGIQRESELEALRDLGVPYGQGSAWDRMA